MHLRAQFGKWGEDVAAQYLLQKGYSILQRNYRCVCGEIDIIVLKDGEITFVEVKARKTLAFGIPAAAVTKVKQGKIHASAIQYLQTSQHYYKKMWFDVVEIYCLNGTTTINHLQHCF